MTALHQILRHVELVRDKVPDWKAFPFTIPAVATLDRLELDEGVTFFVGENRSASPRSSKRSRSGPASTRRGDEELYVAPSAERVVAASGRDHLPPWPRRHS